MRLFTTGELTSLEVKAIRELLDVAFAPDEDERFTEDDWQRAIGGMHFVLDVDSAVAAHASVVVRVLHVRGAPLRTGYVEAVATAPSHQRRGLGTRVMRDVGKYISERFELGALGTGRHGFYERLGPLAGPSSSSACRGSGRTILSEDRVETQSRRGSVARMVAWMGFEPMTSSLKGKWSRKAA